MEDVLDEDQGRMGVGDDSSPGKSEAKKIKTSKTCGVCGDHALGYNFNAVTCESCKAFFRRNALKDMKIHCLFKGDCVVDKRTRRFCPACRIKKCFEVGMKRDMILDDGERKARMAKVLKNRAKKHPNKSQDNIKTESSDPEEFCMESSSIMSPSCSEPAQSSPASDSCCSEIQEKLFQQIPRERLPTDPSMYRKLSEEENVILKEISWHYETTVAALPDMTEYSQPEKYQNVNDLVNNTEICVRQLIKFMKQLDDFRCLSQKDQISCLKGSIMKSQLLRSVAFYIVDRDAWLTQKGEIPTSILCETTGFMSLHTLHVRYCRTLKAIVQNNFTLYALMQVMLIFNPDCNNIADRELMSNLQDKYISLLKHYLEAEYSFEFAQVYFVAILRKMSELKSLSDQHSHILLQVNPSQVEPLMLEVLNL